MALGNKTRIRRQVVTPQIKYEMMNSWGKGLFSRLDAERVPLDGLKVTENLRLNQNGTVGPRPGLKLYGTQPTGTVVGQIFEYVRLNTLVTPNVPETWNVWFENRSGTGYIITSKDGGAHTVVTGKTYTVTGAKPHFEQVYGKVVISTGVDYLSFMDVQTQTITSMTALSTPSGVSAVATGISGTNQTLRFRVTATNAGGETAGSTAQTVGVSQIRDTWNGTTQFVTFTWNRITGASRYNIYVGDSIGLEYFLDSVADVGSGSTQAYVDTGATFLTTTRVCPAGDSTAGPKLTRVANIKGQPYGVGDTDNLGRIWFGGYGSSALDFSSYNGGGWVEPNKGGKDFPVRVIAFRDGKGTPMAACMSKGTNGAGKRYLLQPATTTVGSTVVSYMAVMEDNGADGTDSPDGVVFHNDGIWYPSRNGFKTSNTRASLQNIISTQGISDNIGTDVETLVSTYMEYCCGLVDDQQVYWALPYLSTSNNQVWVLDLRQKGAWMRPWDVECDWMWHYADNTDGKTKFLMLVNNGFYEVDKNTATNDNGVTFQTAGSSGGIRFGDNGEWANVIDITFHFLRPQGNINLSCTVHTEDGDIPYTDTMTASSNSSVSAWGRFGWSAAGWGQMAMNLVPVSSASPRRKWTIDIDEECDYLSYGWTTTESGISYQLEKVVIRYVPIGYKEIDNS
jgi:hypothetical protein